MNRFLRPLGLVVIIALMVTSVAFAAPGDLDPTFGTDGVVLIEDPTPNIDLNFAIQTDGKILVADQEFIGRFLPNGSIDSSFGTNGFVLLTDVYIDDIALDQVGRIVIFSHIPNTSVRFTRYLANGAVDTSFGTAGSTELDYPPQFHPEVGDVFVLPDGKIVGVAEGRLNPQNTYILYRLLAEGAPDNTFGSGGIISSVSVSPNFRGMDAALQDDGKILVAGNGLVSPTQGGFKVARINQDGSLDATFSGDGITEAAYTDHDATGYAVVVQPDGKVLVGGFVRDNPDPARYALVRFNVDGSLDTSFASAGMVIGADATGWSIHDVELQEDGSILVVGGKPSLSAFAARFLPSGSIDTTFGTNGIVSLALDHQTHLYSAVYQSNLGMLLVGGLTVNPPVEIPCNPPFTPPFPPCYSYDADLLLARLIVEEGVAPSITSAASTIFNEGFAGSFTVTATGDPAPTFSLTGTLPSGVSFDGVTGVLSGTPATNTAGSYPVTVTATNGTTPDASQNFTLVVQKPVVIAEPVGNGSCAKMASIVNLKLRGMVVGRTYTYTLEVRDASTVYMTRQFNSTFAGPAGTQISLKWVIFPINQVPALSAPQTYSSSWTTLPASVNLKVTAVDRTNGLMTQTPLTYTCGNGFVTMFAPIFTPNVSGAPYAP